MDHDVDGYKAPYFDTIDGFSVPQQWFSYGIFPMGTDMGDPINMPQHVLPVH
jgi:hypothetical protein